MPTPQPEQTFPLGQAGRIVGIVLLTTIGLVGAWYFATIFNRGDRGVRTPAYVRPATAVAAAPSARPTARPRRSPVASARVIAEPARTAGLELSRAHFVSAFDGLTFKSSPLRDGQERVLGFSANKTLQVGVIGPAANVTKVELVVFGTRADAYDAGSEFLDSAMRAWRERHTWLDDALANARHDQPITRIEGAKRVTLTVNETLGATVLEVSAR